MADNINIEKIQEANELGSQLKATEATISALTAAQAAGKVQVRLQIIALDADDAPIGSTTLLTAAEQVQAAEASNLIESVIVQLQVSASLLKSQINTALDAARPQS